MLFLMLVAGKDAYMYIALRGDGILALPIQPPPRMFDCHPGRSFLPQRGEIMAPLVKFRSKLKIDLEPSMSSHLTLSPCLLRNVPTRRTP